MRRSYARAARRDPRAATEGDASGYDAVLRQARFRLGMTGLRRVRRHFDAALATPRTQRSGGGTLAGDGPRRRSTGSSASSSRRRRDARGGRGQRLRRPRGRDPPAARRLRHRAVRAARQARRPRLRLRGPGLHVRRGPDRDHRAGLPRGAVRACRARAWPTTSSCCRSRPSTACSGTTASASTTRATATG